MVNKMYINYEKDSELLLKALFAGADELKSNIGKLDLQISTKNSYRDLVTEVDKEIEKTIFQALSPSNYNVISEEQVSLNQSPIRISKEPTWYVDPIDGTVNFVHGLPYHCISIGLLVEGTFKLGGILAPELNQLYFSYAKHGSYLNSSKLSVVDSKMNNALLSGSISGHSFSKDNKENELHAKYFKALSKLDSLTRGCMRLGSAALNISFVASNKLQGTFGINNYLWDIAGAAAVAKQAGCKVYIHRIPDSVRVHFIVAVPTVAEVIKQELEACGLVRFDDQNGEGLVLI